LRLCEIVLGKEGDCHQTATVLGHRAALPRCSAAISWEKYLGYAVRLPGGGATLSNRGAATFLFIFSPEEFTQRRGIIEGRVLAKALRR